MKKLLHDTVIQTVTALVVFFWLASACTAVTGLTYSKRRWFHEASAAEMENFWRLPTILTVVWSPIILWRAWKLRK